MFLEKYSNNTGSVDTAHLRGLICVFNFTGTAYGPLGICGPPVWKLQIYCTDVHTSLSAADLWLLHLTRKGNFFHVKIDFCIILFYSDSPKCISLQPSCIFLHTNKQKDLPRDVLLSSHHLSSHIISRVSARYYCGAAVSKQACLRRVCTNICQTPKLSHSFKMFVSNSPKIP